MQTATKFVSGDDVALGLPSTVSPVRVAAPQLKTVARRRVLFAPGHNRHLYRVKSGALCHFTRWPDGRLEIIGFAFPGELIGFGYLSKHTSSAVAMVDTVVSPVSADALSQAFARDADLAFKFVDAGEREFEFLRSTSRPASLLPPLKALARYLSAIASINATEGRDAIFSSDELSSDYVARQLNMSIENLSMALLSLARSGIVEACGKSWRVKDAARLEALASDPAA